MRILITGAAGFLGSNLSHRLLDSGHEVLGVDNFTTGCRVNVAALEKKPSFHFEERDVIDGVPVEGALDWVMHFACPASPPKYLARPIETMRVMSEGTHHLLELCRAKRAKFFLASTSEVYGDPHVHPQPETFWGTVNPVGPRAVYDEAKRFAEAMTTAYNTHHQVDVRIIRIFNTFGPRMDPDDGRVVTNFIHQAMRGEALTIYGDGRQTRSFQYVDDLLDGIEKMMAASYTKPVNLGNPSEHTMLELAEMVQELVGSTLPLRREPLPQDDPKQRRPDITLARTLLGWEPTIAVREGVRRTIEWFRGTGDSSPERRGQTPPEPRTRRNEEPR